MRSIYKDFYNPPNSLDKNEILHRLVIDSLQNLYYNKCAYSEEYLNIGRTFEIDQYRPVELYPDLEFEWSNLLPCSKEVKTRKSNLFKVNGIQRFHFNKKSKRADSYYLQSKEPLLLHPEVDRPENHFTFD